MSRTPLTSIKVLFAKSRNTCAFPDCKVQMVEPSGTVTGEICHIRSETSRGPRHEKSYPSEQINSPTNLILLCGRHHKIIDTEVATYETKIVLSMKQRHEERGVVEISPQITTGAKALLAKHEAIVIANNSGNVAINSPGAIFATVVNVKTTKAKIVTPTPNGAIGASQPMSAYCKYLVARYNEYQKADFTGKTAYKYMALPNAVIREFGNRWQDLPESLFESVTTFFQKRIDNTILGRRNKAKSIRNYHQFHEHGV